MFCIPIRRPRDGTTENYFFQMSFYACASACISMHNLQEDKRQIPCRTSRGQNWENKAYKLKKGSVGRAGGSLLDAGTNIRLFMVQATHLSTSSPTCL